MNKRILLIYGHPDAVHPHLYLALERAHEQGALAGGHAVRRIQVADLKFPIKANEGFSKAPCWPEPMAGFGRAAA